MSNTSLIFVGGQNLNIFAVKIKNNFLDSFLLGKAWDIFDLIHFETCACNSRVSFNIHKDFCVIFLF